MVGKIPKQAATLVAVASLGVVVLTGCTSKPIPKTLTTKEAGAYYIATTCKADAAADLFAGALSIAGQSSAETGPDLDNLKSAASDYQEASQTASISLGNPKAAWPSSVRKSILVIRHQYMAELSSLETMSNASQMSDEAVAYSDFPDTKKAAAAAKLIRSKLGLPTLSAANSCPPPPALTVAPATGILIKGTGYTYHAPAGWTLPKRSEQADSYAISAKPDSKGVYDTINVLGSDVNTDTLAEQEQNGAAYLEQVEKATAVQVRPRVEIAGAVSVHVSSVVTHQGITRRTETYAVTHGDNSWVITFDFNVAESQTDREALAESVLASWTWT